MLSFASELVAESAVLGLQVDESCLAVSKIIFKQETDKKEFTFDKFKDLQKISVVHFRFFKLTDKNLWGVK